MDYACFTIKAKAVTDNGNGTFSVEIPAVPLTSDQHKVLDTLFPNLREAAFRLLNQEALLASLATESEIMAPKLESKPKGVKPAACNN